MRAQGLTPLRHGQTARPTDGIAQVNSANARFLACVLLIVLFALGPASASDPIRTYGAYLDVNHLVQVAQEGEEATILLLSRERITGGPHTSPDLAPEIIARAKNDPDALKRQQEKEEPVIRQAYASPLARIRSEVLLVAPPNYVKNPGQRYRVSVEGLEAAPDFETVFEVDAADALAAVRTEMTRIYAETEGYVKDALFFGTMLALRALNEAGHLPADIPLTVLRSEAGQFRIQGQAYSRGEQGRMTRFEDVEEGPEYKRTFEDDAALTTPEPERIHGPAYRRGHISPVARETKYLNRQYRGKRDLAPDDYRAQQVRDLGDPRRQKKEMGEAGRAVTVPEVDMPPISESQRQNLEILRGTTQSAMEARVTRGEQQQAGQ